MEVTKEKFPKMSKRQRDAQQAIEDAAASRRASMRLIADRDCLECGTTFSPVRSWQKFCKPSCRYKNWNDANLNQSEKNENETV